MEEKGDSLDMRGDKRAAKPLDHVSQLGHCLSLSLSCSGIGIPPLTCCQNDCCLHFLPVFVIL